MSLAKRISIVEENQVVTSRKVKKRLKRLAQQQLYEKISPEGISHLVSQSLILARRELEVLLDESIEEVIGEEPLQLAVENEMKDTIRTELLDDILGMGPIEKLLEDPSITEVMVNGTKIFFERSGKLHKYSSTFDNDEHVRLIIDRIIAPLGRRVDERTPLVNARLKEGHRVNAVIPPISLIGPLLTIRKFRDAMYDLRELVEMGTLPESLATFLSWAVKARLNIAVSGGTGSGKTTLLNALSVEIPTDERIITIEDSAELRFHTHPHVISLESRPMSIEGTGEITIQDLMINALRMRPDRIIVGECRGKEALDMLQAMNTGHDGSLTTLHANSPADALSRLTTMVMYGADIPLPAIEEQIFSALDVIVHQQRTGDGSRKITSVVCCKDDMRSLFSYKHGQYKLSYPNTLMKQFVEKGIIGPDEARSWGEACCI